MCGLTQEGDECIPGSRKYKVIKCWCFVLVQAGTDMMGEGGGLGEMGWGGGGWSVWRMTETGTDVL